MLRRNLMTSGAVLLLTFSLSAFSEKNAFGTPITIIEPSFENATAAWVATNTNADANGTDVNGASLTTTDGTSFWRIYFGTAHRTVSSHGEVRQTLTGNNVQTNSVYTLVVAIGDHGTTDLDDFDIRVGTINGGTFTELSGGVLTGTLPANGSFSDYTKTYTTGLTVPSDTLAIQLVAFGTTLVDNTLLFPGGGADTVDDGMTPFDNVRLDVTAVPEPAGFTLLAIAMPLFLRRRRCMN